MKILLTGAHFTPAVAVIKELIKYKNVQIVYVGRKTTMEGDKAESAESQILPSMGVKFFPIITGRLQRIFTIYTIPSLLKIPIGFIQALNIILSEKPKVILSFGGYVAVPVVFAGWLFSIPIIIHEQGLVSGLANKISSLFAEKKAISLKKEVFDESVILTGNPIRDEVLNPRRKIAVQYQAIFNTAKKEKLPVVLIMGGNQGSHVINLAVEEVLNRLVKMAGVIHVTGDNKFGDYERLQGRGELSDKYLVKKWIGEEYGGVLSRVDLAICRGGANTLTEVVYLKKPALVIPIPYLYEDEQNKNAKYFKDLGIVRILPQSKLSGKSLMENLKFMLNNLQRIKQRANDAKKSIIPNAAKRLALETISMI